MSVRIVQLILSFTALNICKPFESPTPLVPLTDVRFALSKDALKTKLIFSYPHIFFRVEAIITACSSVSSWQGPAMRVIGSSFPIFISFRSIIFSAIGIPDIKFVVSYTYLII